MRDKDQILMEEIYLTEMIELGLYTIITENQHLIAEGKISEYIKKIANYTKDMADKSKQGTDEAVRSVYLKMFEPIKSKLQQFSKSSPKSAKIMKLLTNPTNIRAALILATIVTSAMGTTTNAGEFEQTIDGFLDLGEMGSSSDVDLETTVGSVDGVENILDRFNDILGSDAREKTLEAKRIFMQQTGKSPSDENFWDEFKKWSSDQHSKEKQAEYDANVASINQYKIDNPDWDDESLGLRKMRQHELDYEAQKQAEYDANVASIENNRSEMEDQEALKTQARQQASQQSEIELSTKLASQDQAQRNKTVNRIINMAKNSITDPSKMEKIKTFAQTKGIEWSEIQPHVESTFRNRDNILMEHAYNQVQG